MRQKSVHPESPSERIVKNIRRATRKRHSSEEKIRIVLDGLRVSELVDLRWDQVEFATAALHVRRVKQGTPATHPILGDELRHCGGSSAIRSPSRRSCSRLSGARRSARPGSLA